MNDYQKEQCDNIISRCSILSAAATCNPLPGGDTVLILLIQMWMLNRISNIMRVPESEAGALNLLKHLASQRITQYAVNELINIAPIGIPMANAILSYYITKKIGWEAVQRLNENRSY